MAVPKKKSSRSRRSMRRFSCAYQIADVPTTKLGTQTVRTHTVTLESLDSYLAARKERKAARKSVAV